jgi:hypothetical protein
VGPNHYKSASYVHVLKLPPFWPVDPNLRFAQVEAQSACRRITSQCSKFDYIVSSLALRDLLADHAYDTLKAQLTKRTTASEQRSSSAKSWGTINPPSCCVACSGYWATVQGLLILSHQTHWSRASILSSLYTSARNLAVKLFP